MDPFTTTVIAVAIVMLVVSGAVALIKGLFSIPWWGWLAILVILALLVGSQPNER